MDRGIIGPGRRWRNVGSDPAFQRVVLGQYRQGLDLVSSGVDSATGQLILNCGELVGGFAVGRGKQQENG